MSKKRSKGLVGTYRCEEGHIVDGPEIMEGNPESWLCPCLIDGAITCNQPLILINCWSKSKYLSQI